jgi:parallel beta-helix repeat protein/cysteine-rich repeat protein
MVNNNNKKRGEMYKQKRGAIALIGLVAMFVVVIAGSLFLASKDGNSLTGASIGFQEFSGTCNISVTESVNNIGHDFLCQNTDGFIINADNIIFDCQDHFIKCTEGCNATSNTIGIRINNQSNVTIQNCYVYNFTEGVRLEVGATNNLITNNYLYNNSDGIEINLAGGNNITRNIIDQNPVCGINITTNHNVTTYTSYNRIWDNKIWNTSGGLEACSNASSHNYWYTSKICGTGSVNIIGYPCLGGNNWLAYTGVDTSGDGLGDTLTPYNGGGISWDTKTAVTGDYNPLVDSCDSLPGFIDSNVTCGNKTLNSTSGEGYAIMKSNLVFTCNGTALNGDVSDNATLSNNTGYNEDKRGIEIKNMHDVTVIGCEIYNFTYGVYIQNSYNVNLVNLNVHDNNYTGIYVGALTYNITIENSTFGDYGTDMQKYGIWLHGSRPSGGNNIILRNTFVNNTERGIYLSDSSNTNTISSNNISGSTDGIFVNGSIGNNIYNNRVYNNSNAGINALSSTISETGSADSSSGCLSSCESAYSSCPGSCSTNLGPCQTSCGDSYTDCFGTSGSTNTSCYSACNTTYTSQLSTCTITYNICDTVTCPNAYPDANQTSQLGACQSNCTINYDSCATGLTNSALSNLTSCQSTCDTGYTTDNAACAVTNSSCYSTCDSTYGDGCTSTCQSTYSSCTSGCNTQLSNTIYNNIYGYYLESSLTDLGLTGTIYNNTYGIYLNNSPSDISSVTLYNNSEAGIYINNSDPGSQYININDVTINGSNYGIYAQDSLKLKLGSEGSVDIYNNTYGIYFNQVNSSVFTSDTDFGEGPITIHNNSIANILLQNAYFNTFDYITVYGGSIGVNLTSSNNNIFTSSRISNFTSYNLYLNSSNNNTFYNNYFENLTTGSLVSDDGINIWNTTYNTSILGNNILGYAYWGGNYWGNYTGADTTGDGIGNTLLPYNNSGNIVTGGDYLPLTLNLAGCGNIVADVTIVQDVPSNGTCFVVSAANITIDFAGKTLSGNGSGCGVNISNYDGVKVINANIQNFSTAICVDPAVNINISNNNLTQNTNGITFEQINDSFISNNKIFNNTNYGLQLTDSYNNTIFTNNITLNGYGLYATSSNNNSIYNNYFNNTVDAYDSGSNNYNTTYATSTSIINGTGYGGNFWSTYLGRDSAGGTYPYNISNDSVGDTNIPFTLGNIQDYLPLTSNNGTTGLSNCLSIGTSTKLGSHVNCTNGNGITITADDVVLDCDGKIINGGGIASGILVDNYDNVVIKNCNITNFYYGIKVLGAEGTQIIEGNDLRLNDFYGIYLYQTTSTLIDSNSLVDDNNGVYMIGSSGTNITNNTINLQKKFYGIYGYESTNNVINDNTLWDNYHGIYLVNSSYTNVSNNNITASDVYSLFVHKSTTYSYFTNNSLSTGREAIRIKSSSNNNQFSGNRVTNHTNYGVYSTDSDSNTFTNNTIQNNSANVYLSNSKTNDFVNNTITLGTSGIQAISSSNGLILTNNTINSTTNTTPCLEINDSSNADISDNLFYNDVHLNNADGTTMDLNNSVVTYLNINGSDTITLSGNILNYVDIEPTTGTTITGNTIVQLDVLQFASGEISSNTVTNNNLTAFNLKTVTSTDINDNDIQNTTLAILLSAESTGNSVYNNWIKNNGFGLNITNSTINTIYNNYFSNGISQNVYDDGGNTWYDDYTCGVPNIVGGPCKGGNFYSDYYGLDNGVSGTEQGDGIGDQPSTYTIATSNTDNYPLVLYVARQYFDQVSPYNTTYNAYGNISGLLDNGEAVPTEVQIINYTNTSGAVFVEITGLFNQSDVHAETLKINHTDNKTAVNKTGVTGEVNAFSVYLYHNYEFDAGVYICENTYNLSLDETCSSGVNLTTIATSGAYTLSHNNGYYKVVGITNESITAGINKNGYCGANILHDVTLTENVNCNGSAFVVLADNITIDFAGYTLTGNSSGIGVNVSSYNNTIIKNANLVNFSTAIYVDPATGINITNNNISDSGTGIYFSQINDSFIIYNLIWNNTIGMNLSDSYNNTIYNNYFSNTNNTIDNGNNTYYITNTTGTNILSLANSAFSLGLTVNTTNLGGNYWGDYSGWDTSPNGFGDTLLPYNNSGQINNTGDLYPLTDIGQITCGGTTQNVTTNITLVSSLTTTGTCFTLTGNNLNLNCGGYSITGDGGSNDYGFDMGSVDGTNISDCTIINFSIGARIVQGVNHSITSCTFENNTNAGISISNALSSNISILNVTIFGNSINGINLSNSSFVNITNSTIYNVSTGIVLTTSPNNTLTGNTISNNTVGMNLTSSSDNTVYNNYFNSTLNVQDNGTNYWNTTNQSGVNIISGSYIGGNYWSDYNGTDSNSDGFGDTDTYNITNSSDGIVGYDYLPLINGYTCGDGSKNGTEECDDGNGDWGDDCSPTCTLIYDCSDNIDNDADGLNDTLDPGCHTDYNETNSSSYNATKDSETYCGDTVCETGESCSSCAGDCGVCTSTDTGSGGGGGGGGGGSTTATATTNCTEDWVCGDWSECIGSKQTRNCNDVNLCESLKKAGTISKIIDTAKPKESKSCTVELTPTVPLPQTPVQKPSIIGAMLPESPIARNATLASLAAVLIFGGVYASWYLSSSRNRLKRKLRKITPLLGEESHDILKAGYLDIYHLYLKLSEGHKQNYYSKVTKLREKLEDQLKAEKRIQELLEDRTGDIKEQKETYLLAYKQYQKLPEKVKKTYYPDLVNFRDQLERGKSS